MAARRALRLFADALALAALAPADGSASAAESAPAAGAGPAAASSAGAISLATLLPEMVDLARLAEFPQPAYGVSESTSRRMPPPRGLSKSAAGNYLRIDQRQGVPEYVLMEAAGPGVITLIAIAKSFKPDYQCVLRIYIDDMAVPVIQGPMARLLSGTHPDLPYPLAADASCCWNLYLPIAYAARCRVASDDPMLIYHVVSRSYPPGTTITSFAPARSWRGWVARGGRAGEDPGCAGGATGGGRRGAGHALRPRGGARRQRGDRRLPRPVVHPPLAPAGAAERRDRDGSAGCATACVDPSRCDGETTVAAPVPDFFGSAPGINPATGHCPWTWPPDGWMDSRWVMPFCSAATITIANHGPSPIRLHGETATADYAWTPATMLFHAKWRHQLDVPTVPARTWNQLTAAGRGVFVGSAFSIDNPLQAWWGEGAERMVVDGEASPSMFGTGSDDFYGLGYCSPALFSHPYHGQTRCDGPANYGRTSLYRFAILDRIPFTSSFRFDMELMHWKDCLVDLDATDYWYALPGSSDGFAPLPAGDLALRPSRPYQRFHAAGAIEAEAMRILQSPGGCAVEEGWGEVGDGHWLRWAPARAGDTLVLGFAVAAAGDYRIIGQFLRGAGFATIQLACNGQRGAGPLALAKETFYPDPTGEIDLGVYHLAAGANRLEVTSLAGAPAPVGIDYIIPLPIR